MANLIIEVNRYKHRLTLWKKSLFARRYKKWRAFTIATGALGHETPQGVYFIQEKALDPTWEVPDSPWVKDLGLIPGTKVPPEDPNNPLKVAFLAIYQGVGIHGTGDLASLGTDASHGCIRMHPISVKWLYDHAPVGTPVVII